MKRHDHRLSLWVVAGGHLAWCYRCGAIRKLKSANGNLVYAVGKWTIPTGPNGKNPAMPYRSDRKGTGE